MGRKVRLQLYVARPSDHPASGRPGALAGGYRVKPDVIVETGIAHGGSLIFYASLCKAIGKGRVIGVDVEIRPYNRSAIEAHELSSFITLIEGDAIDPSIVEQVTAHVPGRDRDGTARFEPFEGARAG